MALPPSGPISISMIKAELGSSSNSLRTLSSLAGFSTPDAMSEFYGYSANSTISYNYNAVGAGYQYSYVVYNSIGDLNDSGSRVLGATVLSPTAQIISVDAYDSTSNGVSIDYYINGIYQTQYNSSTYISTGNISTTSGNAYYFIIYTGAIA
jgi:hypothetical protein